MVRHWRLHNRTRFTCFSLRTPLYRVQFNFAWIIRSTDFVRFFSPHFNCRRWCRLIVRNQITAQTGIADSRLSISRDSSTALTFYRTIIGMNMVGRWQTKSRVVHAFSGDFCSGKSLSSLSTNWMKNYNKKMIEHLPRSTTKLAAYCTHIILARVRLIQSPVSNWLALESEPRWDRIRCTTRFTNYARHCLIECDKWNGKDWIQRATASFCGCNDVTRSIFLRSSV